MIFAEIQATGYFKLALGIFFNGLYGFDQVEPEGWYSALRTDPSNVFNGRISDACRSPGTEYTVLHCRVGVG